MRRLVCATVLAFVLVLALVLLLGCESTEQRLQGTWYLYAVESPVGSDLHTYDNFDSHRLTFYKDGTFSTVILGWFEVNSGSYDVVHDGSAMRIGNIHADVFFERGELVLGTPNVMGEQARLYFKR